MPHPLDGAYLRIERAQHHIAELNALESAFRVDHEKDIVIEFHPVTQIAGVVLKEEAKVVPPIFSVIAGEATYNLRAALDYLVFELVKLDWGARTQNRAKFLIEDSSSSLWGKVKGRNGPLRGLSDKHVAMVEGLQPYKGHAWAKKLRDISNPDKHRELSVTRGAMAGMAVFHFDMPPDWTPPPMPGGISLPYYKSGRVVHARDPRGRDVSMYHDITLFITFSDGLWVVNTLQVLQQQVAATLDAFRLEF